MQGGLTSAHGAARKAYEALADDELAAWSIVSEMHDWAGALLGNGASLAVWNGFRYGSLYETARSESIEHRLSGDDEKLFEALSTTNFESVLADLRTTAIVNDALGLDFDAPIRHYESVREALVAAVHAVHVPWADVPSETLEAIKRALVPFEYVFTTNYDLLAYWAAMSDEPGGLPDYFWTWAESSLVFDPRNTEVWNKATKLLFLHGGLHLYQLPDGRVVKRVPPPGTNLLDVFGDPLEDYPDAIPLFVSEGAAEDKMAAIRRSEYLTFALTTFADFTGPLVVFGHSLSEQDQHLVDVLRRKQTPVAVSIRPADPETVLARKTEIEGRLHSHDVLFFDASTHPLGRAELAVKP